MTLRQCKLKENHWYSDHLSECPYCKTLRETGNDPFPGPDRKNIFFTFLKVVQTFNMIKGSILNHFTLIVFVSVIVLFLVPAYSYINNAGIDIPFDFPSETGPSGGILPTPIEQNLTNSIGMNFVLIPAGTFYMGSPPSETGRSIYEGPAHQVNISNAFYLSTCEVTQKQWTQIMGSNPSVAKGEERPVDHVSWSAAQEFIKKLNENESTDKYRLPSEAEWEYAARAGTNTSYYFGDDASYLSMYAWYSINSGGKTHIVGQKQPNSWGLYDMYGNVVEWTQDEWHPDYTYAPTDGSAWEDGDDSKRVVRGGSCDYFAKYCRSAYRDYDYANNIYNGRGLRLVMEL